MEKAIKIAIENGWTLDLSQTEHYGGVPLDKGFLLDPLFWQALGKGLGWKPLGADGDGNDNWSYYWHRFIDHLIEGKDINSFFTNLMK